MSTTTEQTSDPKKDEPAQVPPKKTALPTAPSIMKLKEDERKARIAQNEKIAKSGRPIGRPEQNSVYIANPNVTKVTVETYRVECPYCTHPIRPIVLKTMHPKRVKDTAEDKNTEPKIITRYCRCPDCTNTMRINYGVDGKPFGIYKDSSA